MTRVLHILSLAAIASLAVAHAEARPTKPLKVPQNEAIRAREAAMSRFSARMNRLDALMGAAPAGRARSAAAEP